MCKLSTSGLLCQIHWEVIFCPRCDNSLLCLSLSLRAVYYSPGIRIFLLKSWGMISSTTFRDGQMFNCPNLRYIKVPQEIMILLTVEWYMLYKCPRWLSTNRCLSWHMTRKTFSLEFSFLGLPKAGPGSGWISVSEYSGPTSLLAELQNRMFSPFLPYLSTCTSPWKRHTKESRYI